MKEEINTIQVAVGIGPKEGTKARTRWKMLGINSDEHWNNFRTKVTEKLCLDIILSAITAAPILKIPWPDQN